jgi:putative phosphoribosyl transferase
MNQRTVDIPAPPVHLVGDLSVPEDASGLVVFAHGSGSSRLSRRNRQVAFALNEHRLATLLLDLLTAEEERDRANVFDIELLSSRLVAATRWASAHPQTSGLPGGYFGASTGAAAALCAAATLGDSVGAVVSRGGRPDLAAECLERVTAPTLLIVGGADPTVLALNRQAGARLNCPHRIEVVPGATHLFEESGALERVSGLAAAWFANLLNRDARRHPGFPHPTRGA